MLLRIAERTAVLLVSLAVSSVLVFGFMVLLPGDPARVALGVNATEADAQLYARLAGANTYHNYTTAIAALYRKPMAA